MHRGDELVVAADGRCISQDLFERLVSELAMRAR